MNLQYIFISSKCFTNGHFYDVQDSDDARYYIASDNQGEELYIEKENFKN
jgi:hypothetical protein